MIPYILVLTVIGGLGTSSSPTILRFHSQGSCIVIGEQIANSIKRQASQSGANTVAPVVSYECVADRGEVR